MKNNKKQLKQSGANHGRLFTVREAAEALGYSQWTVYRMVAERRIAYCKLRRSVRIPEAEINRLVSVNMVPAIA